MRRSAAFVAALGIVAFLAIVVRDVRAEEPLPPRSGRYTVSTSTPFVAPPKGGKLSSSLARLVEAAAKVPKGASLSSYGFGAVSPPTESLLRAGLLRIDGRERAQVYVRVGDPYSAKDVVGGLEALGGAVERISDSGDVVQASVPIGSLDAIAGLQAVGAVTTPSYGQVNVGSRLTEGDALLGFDAVRGTYGISGAGVTIGVISDGIAGLNDAMLSGDLPATTLTRDGGGKLISTSGGVIATSFSAGGDLEAFFGRPGAEGTAILEIVHDIAPGAQLRFANFETSLEFMDAVDFLAERSDIVIDDFSFFTGHNDQTSPVSINTSEELNRPGNPIRGYYTSVGNYADRHYEEGFVAAGTCGRYGGIVPAPHTCQEFKSSPDTTDAFSIGAVPANPVFVPAGGVVVVSLSWDDSFGNTTSNYDLLLFQEDPFGLVAVGDDNNTITGEPTEFIVFTNQTGLGKWYDIVVVNVQGASAPHRLEMFVRGGVTLPNDAQINFNTTRGSVPDQSDAGGGVVSVGAIDAADPGIDDAELFSSRGPTNNGVLKPDVAAIDGVAVTGSGGFPSTFFGTSAAAPHVAGLAALLMELAPDLRSGDPAADRNALRNAILNGAVDLGPGGPDNTFGFGRVNGLSAAQALAPAAADLSVAKAGSPDPVLVGELLTYTLTSANGTTSTLAATGVTLTDSLATSTVFVSASAGCVYDAATHTVTCGVGNLGVGAFASTTIAVTPTAAGAITNTAEVTGNELDLNPANNVATSTTTVDSPAPPAADLSVTKAGSPDPVLVGELLTYTLTSANGTTSTLAATGVTLTDSLATSTVFVSASAGCVYDAATHTVTCGVGNLGVGAFASTTIAVTPTAAGVITNTAEVAGNELDLNPANNTATSTTTVNSPALPAADLSVAKAGSPDPVLVGELLTYTLTSANGATSTLAASGVTLTDSLATSTVFVSASAGCVYDAATHTVTCGVGNLGVGAFASTTIAVTPTAAGVMTNTAEVTGNELDLNPANNTATSTTTVNSPALPAADLSVAKADSPDPVLVGELLTYTLTSANGATSTLAATGVTLTDSLATSTVFVSASAGCVYDAATHTVTCGVGNLGVGAFASTTIAVTPTAAGVITNTAEVTGNELDLNPANNVATSTTTVNSVGQPGAVVVAPVAPTSIPAGQPFDVIIQADDVTDLAGAQMTLIYDPTLLAFNSAALESEFDGCAGAFGDVSGALSLVFACGAGGHTGAPLAMWKATFTSSAVTVATTTELSITGVVAGDSQFPSQSILAVGATTTIAIVPGVCGDLNDDGVINVFDAITLLQIIVGLVEPTANQMTLGDVVRDGTINVFDAILVLQHIVGLTEITDCGPP